MKVFIADDSREVRERLLEMIYPLKGVYVVGVASDCAEAYKTLQETKPDVAILDMRMPGGSGYHLLKEIKEEMPDLKVIVLTNFPDFVYREWCHRLGADCFFDKSKEFSKVPETLENFKEAIQ